MCPANCDQIYGPEGIYNRLGLVKLISRGKQLGWALANIPGGLTRTRVDHILGCYVKVVSSTSRHKTIYLLFKTVLIQPTQKHQARQQQFTDVYEWY